MAKEMITLVRILFLRNCTGLSHGMLGTSPSLVYLE